MSQTVWQTSLSPCVKVFQKRGEKTAGNFMNIDRRKINIWMKQLLYVKGLQRPRSEDGTAPSSCQYWWGLKMMDLDYAKNYVNKHLKKNDNEHDSNDDENYFLLPLNTHTQTHQFK